MMPSLHFRDALLERLANQLTGLFRKRKRLPEPIEAFQRLRR